MFVWRNRVLKLWNSGIARYKGAASLCAGLTEEMRRWKRNAGLLHSSVVGQGILDEEGFTACA